MSDQPKNNRPPLSEISHLFLSSVRDRQTGKTELVGGGRSAALSADGRFVAFGDGDILVGDRQTGKTELVSVEE